MKVKTKNFKKCFYSFFQIEGDEGKQIRCHAEAFSSELKKILEENDIVYESGTVIDLVEESDDYDEDQGGRIIPLNPDLEMAKEFYGYFWGRTDVFAKRGKNGGYFPQC